MFTLEQASKIYQGNSSRGFYAGSDKPYFARHQRLEMIKELAEASEAHKNGFFTPRHILSLVEVESPNFAQNFKQEVKDRFEDEIADFCIRVLDYLGWLKAQEKTTTGLPTRGSGKTAEQIFENYESLREHRIGIPKEVENPKRNYIVSAAIFTIMESVQDNQLEYGLLYAEILSEQLGINLAKHIELKLAFNATRARLHGKKY
ncbi:MAG: hypothetical protein HRT70_10250 [Flavobacteriaceae bacterium]|nr:hypothetical protein [Flavobacteriaceae bacterium]